MKKFDAVTTFDNKTFMPQIFLMVLLISQKEIMGIKSQVCFKIPTFVNGRRIYPFNKGLRIYGGGVTPPFWHVENWYFY